MQIQLIDGVFSVKEAEALLQEIFQVKMRFHENRINLRSDAAEDVEHSERRIVDLQQRLRDAIQKIKASGKDRITLFAAIEVNTAQRLTQ